MSALLKVQVLLIRAWIHKLDPVRVALNDAGYELHFTRVDIEPALNAALTRGRFDVVIHDPTVAAISRELLEQRLREHRHGTPIVTLGELETLADAVAIALAAVLN